MKKKIIKVQYTQQTLFDFLSSIGTMSQNKKPVNVLKMSDFKKNKIDDKDKKIVDKLVEYSESLGW